MPPEAGIPVSEDERYYVVQTHFDNPSGVAGVTDNSSVRLHFSDTPRQYEAGTLSIGDAFVALQDQPVSGNRTYTFTCPSECTSRIVQPSITVYASMLHAHLLGLRLWTNVYRNGSFVRTIESSAYWSNDHQRNTLLQANTTLVPGDELRVSCEYGVDKVTAAEGVAPVFGLATTDEMCQSYLFVYPRPAMAAGGSGSGGSGGDPPRLSYCVPKADADGTLGTFCGAHDAAGNDPPGSMLAIDSTARADTGGLTSPYGETPMCRAASE